jgi:hypothetical protein
MYINPSRIVNKYELTSIVEDDTYMEDYFKSVLKDSTPVKPRQEHEYHRSANVNTLDRHYGRSTDNDMYKPDLFLGDMSRDPRSLADSANLGKVKDFMLHRKAGYQINMLNDDDKRINSQTMTHAQQRRAKDIAFKRVKDRYTNFQEQTVGLAPTGSVFATTANPAAQYELGHKSKYQSEFNNKKQYKQRIDNSLTDYTIKSKESYDNKSRSHKQSQANYSDVTIGHNVKDSTEEAIRKANVISIMNLSERKNESLDSYKLSADNKESKSSKTKTQHIQAQAERSAEESSKSNESKTIQNRIQHNQTVAQLIKNVAPFDHKVKLNELSIMNQLKAREVASDNRKSEMSNKKSDSVEQSVNKKRVLLYNDSVVKNAVLGKHKDSSVIFNYKTKKPDISVAAVEKSGKLTIVDNYANRQSAAKGAVTTYNQIGIHESKKEDVDHSDYSTSKLAGSSGPIGSKYLRGSQHFEEVEDQKTSKLV